MKNLLSRYRPRFIRSLVYMAQASEYDVRDFLRWYHRTRDFAHVEKRKQLEKTPKALVLLFLSWSVLLVSVALVAGYVSSTGDNVLLMVGIVVVALTPFYFPYAFALVMLLLRIAQYPIEESIVASARRKLMRHAGFKIAIAGSYGKTSMREILKTVLAEGKRVAAPPGSHNTPLGLARFVQSLSGDEEVLIFELGEYYPGDIRTLSKLVEPDLGIITGVNEAHLEKFKTLSAARDTIFEIADFVAPNALYINGENEYARANAKEGNILYSRAGAGRFIAQDAESNLDGTSLTFISGDAHVRANTSLLGLHQVGPLMLAAEIASRLGLSMPQIVEGIKKIKPFAHRLEKRVDASGVVTLDDSYNGNPDGVAAVIDFLGKLRSHRRWYVTPGLVEMGPRAEAVHRDIGTRLAQAGIEKVVLIRDSVTPYIESGLKTASFTGDITWFDDMPQALAALSHSTVSGDVMLIQNDWPDQYV